MAGKKSSRHLGDQNFSCLTLKVTIYISEVKWVMRGSYFLPNTIEFILFYFCHVWWILLISLVCKANLKRSKHFTIRIRYFVTWEDAIFNPSAILLDTNKMVKTKNKEEWKVVSSLFISIGRPSSWDICLFPSNLLLHQALLAALLKWTGFKERIWMNVLHVRKENQSKNWKQSTAKFKAKAFFFFYLCHLYTWSGHEAENYLDNCKISLTLCILILNYTVFYFLSTNSSISKLNWNK